MAHIRIELDTSLPMDREMLSRLVGATTTAPSPSAPEKDTLYGVVLEDDEQEETPEAAPQQPQETSERRVSPYGFADPDREPGKAGEGRKRRTKAEMAEDEAWEARQRAEKPAAEDETDEEPADEEPEAEEPAAEPDWQTTSGAEPTVTATEDAAPHGPAVQAPPAASPWDF